MNAHAAAVAGSSAAPNRIGPGTPALAELLVDVLLRAASGKPTCVILPSTIEVSEFTAIRTALRLFPDDAADLTRSASERIFEPGARVRSLEGHFVYKVASRVTEYGTSGAFLMPLDKQNYTQNGRFFVRDADAILFEATERKRPFGPAILPKRPKRTWLDAIAGTTTFGNTSLIRNNVVLVSARAAFERLLERTVLVPQAHTVAGTTVPPLSEVLCWGFLDDKGDPEIVFPEGAAGEPLVAVNGNALQLRDALLGEAERRRLVITSDIRSLGRDPDLFEKLAERNSVLAVADFAPQGGGRSPAGQAVDGMGTVGRRYRSASGSARTDRHRGNRRQRAEPAE